MNYFGYIDKDNDYWYPNGNGTFRLVFSNGDSSPIYCEEPYSLIKEIGIKEKFDLPNGWTPSDGRVEFEGGGMRDSENGKPRFDLLIPENVPFEQQYLTRIARLMAKGAEHYEDRNWEQFSSPEALNRAKSSAFRHFMQWFCGETDEDHAAAIFFNVMAVEHIKGKMN